MVAQAFFYLLDVGTSKALVLYKLSKGGPGFLMSIVEFKDQLVHSFVGSRLQLIPEAVVQHLPVKTVHRKHCAHCALFSKHRRTRFRCSAPECALPLCPVGCFGVCHGSDELHKAVLLKYESMQKKVNERFK